MKNKLILIFVLFLVVCSAAAQEKTETKDSSDDTNTAKQTGKADIDYSDYASINSNLATADYSKIKDWGKIEQGKIPHTRIGEVPAKGLKYSELNAEQKRGKIKKDGVTYEGGLTKEQIAENFENIDDLVKDVDYKKAEAAIKEKYGKIVDLGAGANLKKNKDGGLILSATYANKEYVPLDQVSETTLVRIDSDGNVVLVNEPNPPKEGSYTALYCDSKPIKINGKQTKVYGKISLKEGKTYYVKAGDVLYFFETTHGDIYFRRNPNDIAIYSGNDFNPSEHMNENLFYSDDKTLFVHSSKEGKVSVNNIPLDMKNEKTVTMTVENGDSFGIFEKDGVKIFAHKRSPFTETVIMGKEGDKVKYGSRTVTLDRDYTMELNKGKTVLDIDNSLTITLTDKITLKKTGSMADAESIASIEDIKNPAAKSESEKPELVLHSDALPNNFMLEIFKDYSMNLKNIGGDIPKIVIEYSPSETTRLRKKVLDNEIPRLEENIRNKYPGFGEIEGEIARLEKEYDELRKQSLAEFHSKIDDPNLAEAILAKDERYEEYTRKVDKITKDDVKSPQFKKEKWYLDEIHRMKMEKFKFPEYAELSALEDEREEIIKIYGEESGQVESLVKGMESIERKRATELYNAFAEKEKERLERERRKQLELIKKGAEEIEKGKTRIAELEKEKKDAVERIEKIREFIRQNTPKEVEDPLERYKETAKTEG